MFGLACPNPRSATCASLALVIAVVLAPGSAWSQASQSPLSDKTYEDWYTFERGTAYTLDPWVWVWVYTTAFAKRFRMLDKWVDDTLRGAMAVAFRVNSIGSISCGLGRTENACWPVVNCQMDVYVDSTAPLPWKYPEIRSDFLMNGVASDEYLYDINDNKRRRRYVPKEANQPLKFGLLREIQWYFRSRRFGGFETSPDLNYFDRDFQPGVTLVSFNDK